MNDWFIIQALAQQRNQLHYWFFFTLLHRTHKVRVARLIDFFIAINYHTLPDIYCPTLRFDALAKKSVSKMFSCVLYLAYFL